MAYQGKTATLVNGPTSNGCFGCLFVAPAILIRLLRTTVSPTIWKDLLLMFG
jgi:hypothetical protein